NGRAMPETSISGRSAIVLSPGAGGFVMQSLLDTPVQREAVQTLPQIGPRRGTNPLPGAPTRQTVLPEDARQLPTMDAPRNVGRQPKAGAMIAVEVQTLCNGAESGSVLRHD